MDVATYPKDSDVLPGLSQVQQEPTSQRFLTEYENTTDSKLSKEPVYANLTLLHISANHDGSEEGSSKLD